MPNLKLPYWKLIEKTKTIKLILNKRISDYCLQLRVLVHFFTARKNHKQLPTTLIKSSGTLFFISYYAPPYKSVYGTQRLNKFIKYWHQLGYRITLLTTAPSEDKKEIITNHTDSIDNYSTIFRVDHQEIPTPIHKEAEYIPDKFIGWIDVATDKYKSIFSRHTPKAIITTVPPYSNALAAYILSKTYNIPLIVDFRDPWNKIDLGWIINNRFLRSINTLMEYMVLKQAALIIIADDKDHLPDYLVKGDRWYNKTASITNGYDEEQFNDALQGNDNSSDFFRISYVGSIYDQETLDNIIAPLRYWHQKYPDDLKKVVFVYAGSSKLILKDSFYFLHGVDNKGFLNHQESIELRYSSNLQIFTLPSYIKEHIYTGKIFEMIRTPVPILAICKPNSAPAKLLKKTNTGTAFSYAQVYDASNLLKIHFDNWNNGIEKYSPNKDEIKKYSRKALAEEAMTFINKAISSHKKFN